MSLKNTKNLLIIAAVVVALMAGTVLLGNYTNILSTGSRSKTCQATKSGGCPASQAFFAENAGTICAQKAECRSVAKTCPPDCIKPCCAGEDVPSCCPKSDATVTANTVCCPATSTITE
jgi:hypothetical protein